MSPYSIPNTSCFSMFFSCHISLFANIHTISEFPYEKLFYFTRYHNGSQTQEFEKNTNLDPTTFMGLVQNITYNVFVCNYFSE